MPTDIDSEIAQQALWQLLPVWRQNTALPRMLYREFLPAAVQAARWDQSVKSLVAQAAAHVPYYRDLLKAHGLKPESIDTVQRLSLLPPLTKTDIQRDPARLRAHPLLKGERVAMVLQTSGSTGEPLAVHHTVRSRIMFALNKLRELRWFRMDPALKQAYIRSPLDLPRIEGRMIEAGETLRQDVWMHLNLVAQTGPMIAYSDKNPIEAQLEWLQREQPDYLVCNAAHLEHLALAAQAMPKIRSLKAAVAVATQFTPEMRRGVEAILGVPVHQNYGLNEIGIVAARCPEGGRYHVHAEHCLVEIVDEEGRPCKPGQQGRLLVTAFDNAAMPLIRYDADDLAVVAEGPCPCGRSLPGFAEIVGRYRRTALLPAGAQAHWINLLEWMYHADARPLLTGLRKFQMHLYRDMRFELRMVHPEGDPEPLMRAIQAVWTRYAGPDGHPLSCRLVDDLPRPRGGKFQNFTSDFVPAFDPLAEVSEH